MKSTSCIATLAVIFCFATAVSAQVKISASLGYSQTIPFPQSVINEMGSRNMRYHHLLWHNIRNLWNRLDAATQKGIRDLGWEPPRPALRYDANKLLIPFLPISYAR